MDKFIRNVEVIIGNEGDEIISIKNLFVRFNIKKESNSTAAEGNIDIYNLNKTTENKIKNRGNRVQLLVGYGRTPDLSLIFSGDVRAVERGRVSEKTKRDDIRRMREEKLKDSKTFPEWKKRYPYRKIRSGSDRVTSISVGGHIHTRTNSMFIKAYQSPISVRDIVRDIVQSMNGLNMGSLEAIHPGIKVPSWSFSGPSVQALDAILYAAREELGLSLARWYIDNDTVKFVSDNTPLTNVEHWIINEASGMIGTPTVTDDGMKVKVLLDPRLRLQDNVSVESSLVEDRGFHQITTLEYSGDNRDGDFYTNLELRPI